MSLLKQDITRKKEVDKNIISSNAKVELEERCLAWLEEVLI